MENKKLGFVILSLSILSSILMIGFVGNLNSRTSALSCYPTAECQRVESLLGISHIAVGLISFVAALGIYLLFFSTGEESILKRLEEEKNMKLQEDKLTIMLKSMDENEKKIFLAIKEQDGITQSTLKFRVDLSKAKVSQVINDFEKKNLISRAIKGKTYQVFLRENFN